MRTRVQELMLKHLIGMRDNGPMDIEFGICQNLNRYLAFAYTEYMRELDKLFQTWDKFSGDITFPVPDPKIKADMAYLMNSGDMWDRRTQYGKNRWSLLLHCIVELSKI